MWKSVKNCEFLFIPSKSRNVNLYKGSLTANSYYMTIYRLEAVDDEELETDDEDSDGAGDATSTHKPSEEKNKLRQEFVNSAYQSFLAGWFIRFLGFPWY